MWFTESSAAKIGRLDIGSGRIQEFPVPTASAYPHGITTGPDGNLWFAERDVNQIGRITPSGQIAEFATPKGQTIAFPTHITTDRNGSVWFAEHFRPGIGRIDPFALTFVEYATPANGTPGGITTAPDGPIWVTDAGLGAVDKLTAVQVQ